MSLDNYLTTREAAALLNVSVPTIQQWAERGRFQGWKTAGGHRRIARSSVQEVLEQQRRDAPAVALPYRMPVLVVEDDLHLLRLYRHHMDAWPFAVTAYVAPNGYEALVLAGEVQPRMLVCDLRLPGVSGFNLVRSLCAMPRFQTMGIVVVTGLSGAEIDSLGGLPERVEVMGKPVDFARLEGIAQQLWLRSETRCEAGVSGQ